MEWTGALRAAAALAKSPATLPFPSPPTVFGPRAALVIAHPGHELRVHGWLERARPLTFVLTDGSGTSGRPRLDSTTAVLTRVGARPGSIYGRFSDAAFCQNLLACRFDAFDRLADELCDELASHDIQVVASDAAEGHHPAHDLCRLLVDVAAQRLRHRHGSPVSVFDFPVSGRPDASPPEVRGSAAVMPLGPNTVGRKLAAARGYPELAGDVEAEVRAHGLSAFAVECLRPPVPGTIAAMTEHAVIPSYDFHGQQCVREGRYRQVIRCREHVAPLARHLFASFVEAAA